MADRNRKLSSEDKETWRQALKNVGGISGKESKNYSGDGALIQEVVDEVVVRLETRQRPVTKDLVGTGDKIAAINNLLNIASAGVRLIAIYGMGGIGCNQRLEATNLLHLQNAVVVELSALQFTDDAFKSLIKVARKLKVLTIHIMTRSMGHQPFQRTQF
ncbi:hypothetical protein NL676_019379 [Syzygium grande]|nr:hypothetical protein NL676_019379 [Syzygium grande]